VLQFETIAVEAAQALARETWTIEELG